MTILIIRKHKRFAVVGAASLLGAKRRPHHGLLVEVSLEGCRVGNLGKAKFEIGEQVTFRIGGFEDRQGQVRWASDGCVGLRFGQPFHIAELDRLIRACRPEPGGDEELRVYGT